MLFVGDMLLLLLNWSLWRRDFKLWCVLHLWHFPIQFGIELAADHFLGYFLGNFRQGRTNLRRLNIVKILNLELRGKVFFNLLFYYSVGLLGRMGRLHEIFRCNIRDLNLIQHLLVLDLHDLLLAGLVVLHNRKRLVLDCLRLRHLHLAGIDHWNLEIARTHLVLHELGELLREERHSGLLHHAIHGRHTSHRCHRRHSRHLSHSTHSVWRHRIHVLG